MPKLTAVNKAKNIGSNCKERELKEGKIIKKKKITIKAITKALITMQI
jgi:hypothetical protein